MSARSIWDELLADRWAALVAWQAAGKTESLHLDFKEAAFDAAGTAIRESDRKNLAKGLSGFGNTEGGVLLFGTQTTRGADKVDRLSGLAGVPRLNEYAEKLRALVAGITTPLVPGVVVEALENPGAAGTGVVAVYVPLTDALPFRAEGPAEVSGRYYIRSTTDTTVMPHQVLAALFGRRPHPQLQLGFLRKDVRKVQLFVRNVGRGSAALPLIRVHVDRDGDTDTLRFDVRDPWRDRQGDVYLGGQGLVWHAAVSLLPDQRIYPGDVRLIGSFDFLRADPLIRGRIDTEGAPSASVEKRITLAADLVWIDGS